MAYSETYIANLALAHIGEWRVEDINEATTKGDILSEHYEHARNLVLGAHGWRRLMKQAQLQRRAEDPVGRFAYAYALPANCARIETVADTSEFEPPLDGEYWSPIGPDILSGTDYLFLEYVANDWSVAVYPAYVVEAMGLKLAALVAPHFHGAAHTAAELDSEYEKVKLPRARTLDGSQEPSRPLVRSRWRSARFSGRGYR